jgi:peptidase C39-like protein
MVNNVRRPRTSRTKAIAAGFALVAVVATVTPSPASAAIPATKTLTYHQYTQNEKYNCGPYATKIMLSTMNINPTIAWISKHEGTDEGGTDSITNVTATINYYMTAYGNLTHFHSSFPNGNVTWVKEYLISNILSLHGFVANVVGYQPDIHGVSRGYGYEGHYVAIVGYRLSGTQALISDPGNGQHYYMDYHQLTAWIGSVRGISVTPA